MKPSIYAYGLDGDYRPQMEGDRISVRIWEIRYKGETLVAYDNPDEAKQKADALSDRFMDDGYEVVEVEKEPLI